MSRPLGPLTKKVLIHRVSVEAIPPGAGVGAGVLFLATPGALAKSWSSAVEWFSNAVIALRAAPGENPWREATEEEIAGEILKRIEQKKTRALNV